MARRSALAGCLYVPVRLCSLRIEPVDPFFPYVKMEWSPRRIVNRIVSNVNAACTAVSTPESQIIDLPSVSLSQRRRASEPVKIAPSRSPTIRYPLKCSQAAIRTTSKRWTCLTVCLVPTSDTHSTCKIDSTRRSKSAHQARRPASLVVLQPVTVSIWRRGSNKQLCGGRESDRRASFLRRTERAEVQNVQEIQFVLVYCSAFPKGWQKTVQRADMGGMLGSATRVWSIQLQPSQDCFFFRQCVTLTGIGGGTLWLTPVAKS